MHVRTFGDGDVAAACGLTNYFIEHTAVHFGTVAQSEDEFGRVWRAGCEKFPWLCAEVNGKFAGYAKAGTWRSRAAYDPTAEVTVYVEQAAQRSGVGRALYGELLARLRQGGYHSAIGGVTMPNPGSVRLHEAMGFVHIGTFREVGRKFDRWHDTSWWQVML